MLSSVILWRVPFMRLVTDVVLKIIKFFFACVCSKGFLSLAINLNF